MSYPLENSKFDYFRRKYDLENYLYRTVHKNVSRKGYMSPRDFFMVVKWKAWVTRNTIKNSNQDLKRKIREITAAVLDDEATPTLAEKVARLTEIQGVAVPMASVVLAICFPTRYIYVDNSAWEILHGWLEDGELDESYGSLDTPSIPSAEEEGIAQYLEYQRICSRLASRVFSEYRDDDRLRYLVGSLRALARDESITQFLRGLS